MIDDPALRWSVTALFGVSLAAYAYLAVAQRDRWTCTVNHLLHLAMSVAMILMIWRVDLGLPTMGPTLFFLLAGVWFACLAVRNSAQSGQRLKTGYYAVMMAAMAWMSALMSGGMPGTDTHTRSRPDSAVMDMPGMEMPAHPMPPAAGGFSWVGAANWIGAVGFAAAALYWAWRFAGERRMGRVTAIAPLARMEPVYQAFTAAGTALMFDALIS